MNEIDSATDDRLHKASVTCMRMARVALEEGWLDAADHYLWTAQSLSASAGIETGTIEDPQDLPRDYYREVYDEAKDDAYQDLVEELGDMPQEDFAEWLQAHRFDND